MQILIRILAIAIAATGTGLVTPGTASAEPYAHGHGALEPGRRGAAVTGYTRLRTAQHRNLDRLGDPAHGLWGSVTDLRSYLTLDAQHDAWRVVASADLAGSDHDKGAALGLGYPVPPVGGAPAVRELFVDYRHDPAGLQVVVGRQLTRLGHGIVVDMHGDALRLDHQLPSFPGLGLTRFSAIAIRGASHAAATPGGASESGRTLHSVSDTNSELGVAMAAVEMALWGEGRVQAFIAQQVDNRDTGPFASRRFLDVNSAVPIGPWRFSGEVVQVGGLGPAGEGGHVLLDSFMVLGSAAYTCDHFKFGLTAARGGGDNQHNDNVHTGFQSLFIDETSFTYNRVFSDELHGFDGSAAATARGTGFNNVTFLQPFITWRPLENLTLATSYTLHLATAPQLGGSGPLGMLPANSPAWEHSIGDEVDARLTFNLGSSTVYVHTGAFVPGKIYPLAGLDHTVYALEIGTELRY